MSLLVVILSVIFFSIQEKFCKIGVIGHFRVPKNLTFKTRLSAKFLLWKWVLFAFESEILWNSEMACCVHRRATYNEVWPIASKKFFFMREVALHFLFDANRRYVSCLYGLVSRWNRKCSTDITKTVNTCSLWEFFFYILFLPVPIHKISFFQRKLITK